ncbi:MAG: AMP-binding protein [Ruminococcaceae bacterium]|nr:AMP-binding protein [Oscillospiraceae bacterium]
MKLGFSTRYWPKFSFEDFVTLAKESKFGAIELNDASIITESAPRTKSYLFKNNVEICAINTSINVADENADIEKIKSVAKIARNINAPYIKVYAEDVEAESKNVKANEKAKEIVKKTVTAFLEKAIKIAEKEEVIILVTTRNFFADTRLLSEILKHFSSDYIAADWNMHDTYFIGGEEAEETITNLGAYIKLVHIVDAKKSGEYALVGEGNLPILEMVNALKSVNYGGYVCLEWNPTYLKAVDDIEIILTHYYHFMNDVSSTTRTASHYYYNNTHTGKFLWKKDALIDKTFSQVLDSMAEEFPDQIAFKFTTLDYTRTYSEFRDDVDTFARALLAMGVKKGTQVAVWATNVPEWYIAFWAATKIGAVLVTVNTAYKIHELEYLLKQSDTHTLIMIEELKGNSYKKTVRELCPELKKTKPGEPLHAKRLPFLRNVITIGFKMAGCLTFEEATDRAHEVPLVEIHRIAATIDKNDVANMQYTSGTTGFPKGVMLTHYNIVNNGKCIGDRMDLSTADRLMIQVPMFHCFGMVLAMTAAMTHGCTICPIPYFSAKPALACINQEKITAFHGVPTMFIAMLQHPDFEKTDFSYMRTGIMAGSPCPISVMEEVIEKMNMTQITIVYGQTESSPGCTMSCADDPIEVRVNTVGRALPEVECKVVDPETGEECPDEVTGEFIVRGYNIMKGYYKMPKATASAIDKDGWLHTGDLACRTPEGNYRITGRLKDMIIRGGENIYPKEIEEFIYTHEKVQDIQIIGVPDEALGEEIMACVILKKGEKMTEQELKGFVAASMAKHKVPRYVDFVPAFPMNAAGKILKYKMREDAIKKFGLQKAEEIETA